MKSVVRYVFPAVTLVLLASCASGDRRPEVASGAEPGDFSAVSGPVADFPVKIGPPYTVGGVTYTPFDAMDYDEVGYASHYGVEMSGNRTANGELFNATGVSAAHPTLPLPSYVEVTALDTGKTILVRVNDRGPFSPDRIIDLSSGAARQLGTEGKGVAAVRVRRVNPPEEERGYLRTGGRAPERLDAPEALLTALRAKLAGGGQMPAPSGKAVAARPAPVASTPSGRFIIEGAGASTPRATPPPANTLPSGYQPSAPARGSAAVPVAAVPVAAASSGSYVIQVAAFGSKSRAEELARRIGARVFESADGDVYRVRFGPYASEAEAAKGLEMARQKGYDSAQITRNDAG